MMNISESKCVIVLDEDMPIGTMANTAAILGISLGKAAPEIVGEVAVDASKNQHEGVIQFPVPILKANADKIKEIRMKLYEETFEDVTAIDFSNISQECMTYDDFLQRTSENETAEMIYYGLAIEGPKKKVNKLTGSLALLR